jgi:hypothetical protein
VVRLLCARRERPGGSRSGNDFDEIASSHCLHQGRDHDEWDPITAGICHWRNGAQRPGCAAASLNCGCPLWVKADIAAPPTNCPLYPQKADIG